MNYVINRYIEQKQSQDKTLWNTIFRELAIQFVYTPHPPTPPQPNPTPPHPHPPPPPPPMTQMTIE